MHGMRSRRQGSWSCTFLHHITAKPIHQNTVLTINSAMESKQQCQRPPETTQLPAEIVQDAGGDVHFFCFHVGARHPTSVSEHKSH